MAGLDRSTVNPVILVKPRQNRLFLSILPPLPQAGIQCRSDWLCTNPYGSPKIANMYRVKLFLGLAALLALAGAAHAGENSLDPDYCHTNTNRLRE